LRTADRRLDEPAQRPPCAIRHPARPAGQRARAGHGLRRRAHCRPADPERPHPRRSIMTALTTLERRAMSRLSTPGGGMLIVAADQRNGMRQAMSDDPSTVDHEGLAAAKSDLVRHLGNRAPAILLDPEVALPQVVDDGTLDAHTGLVVALDASGFATTD